MIQERRIALKPGNHRRGCVQETRSIAKDRWSQLRNCRGAAGYFTRLLFGVIRPTSSISGVSTDPDIIIGMGRSNSQNSSPKNSTPPTPEHIPGPEAGTNTNSDPTPQITQAVILGLAQSLLYTTTNETTPLLENGNGAHVEETRPSRHNLLVRAIIWTLLTLLFIVGLVVVLIFQDKLPDSLYPWLGRLPKDPMAAALIIMDKAPVIVRSQYMSKMKPDTLNYRYV